MKHILEGIKWLGIVVASLVLLLVLINIKDHDPHPEIEKIKQSHRDDFPKQENAFYYITGLYVAKDKDPMKISVAYVKEANKLIIEGRYKYDDLEDKYGINALRFEGYVLELCKDAEGHCLKQYKKASTRIRIMLQKNKVLMQRYRSLGNYSRYKSTIIPSITSPIAVFPFSEHRLFLAEQALRFHRGKANEVVVEIVRNTLYWRKMLSNANTLMSKVVAYTLIDMNIVMLSEMVASGKINNASYGKILMAITPLSRAETRLDIAMQGYYASYFRTFDNLFTRKGVGSSYIKWYERLLQPFYQINNSNNIIYNDSFLMKKLDNLNAQSFIRKMNEERKDKDRNTTRSWSWHFPYNPVGKILLHNALVSPTYLLTLYKGRLFNLQGRIRLLSLQIQMQQQSIKPAAIKESLSKAARTYRNPYTGEPMKWDAKEKRIYFVGMNRNIDKAVMGQEVSVRLGGN